MINQFVEGQNLTVGVGKDDCDLKCLSPMKRVITWRIWEFRPWVGGRNTRLLGAFAGSDVFVGFEVLERGAVKDWDRLAGKVDAAWISLFGTEKPLEWKAAPSHTDIGSNFSHV